jgi:hypothetical protein
VKRLVAAVVAALVLFPALARADGDPASDVLIYARVFWPYQVKYPDADAKALNDTVVEAGKKGYKVRVAQIQNEVDLGSAGVLYKHPQDYSKFLAQELANFNTDWLLVVMPNGYGIYHCVGVRRAEGYVDPCVKATPTAADEKLLRSLPVPSKTNLPAAGAEAVKQLAALHGVKVGSSRWPLFAGVGVVIVLAAAGALLVIRRRRRAPVAP